MQSTQWTALFFAAKDGDFGLTRILIQGGSNVWLKDKVYYILLALIAEVRLCIYIVIFARVAVALKDKGDNQLELFINN